MNRFALTVLAVGLLATGAEAQTPQQCVSNAIAGGTPDAITIPLQPCALATNLLILTLSGANTTTTPTLQEAGYPAMRIYKNTGSALDIGELPSSGAVVMLTSTGTSWKLLAGSEVQSLSLPITVPNGGTGDSSLTSHGVLYGNGTGVVGVTAAGATGQFLAGNTGSAPGWSSSLPITSGGTGASTVGGFWTSFGQSSTSVVLSPTGSGVVTISPTTAGTMDNVAVGQTTALAGKFTTLSTKGSSSGVISLLPQAASGTYNWNWPITAGTTGQPLLSAGGSGSAMTWGTLSGTTTKFGTVTGSLTNGNCVAADASGNLVDNGTPCGSGGSGTVTAGTAGQMTYYASSTAAVAGNANANISAGALTLGIATSVQGAVKLAGATSGTITIVGQAAAGTFEFDLPVTAGTAGQFLKSAGGAGAPMTWGSSGLAAISAKTGNFNATSNTSYCVDTVTGTASLTATLPASPANNDVILFVSCSDYSTYNLVIGRNGNNVQGIAADMTVSTNNASFNLIFVTSYGWRMY